MRKSHPVEDLARDERFVRVDIQDRIGDPRSVKNSRMRIMVAFAVENEAMCEQLYYANKGKGGPGGDGYPCSHGDSIESLERQINAIKAWVADHRDWMEIAYTSADARRMSEATPWAL